MYNNKFMCYNNCLIPTPGIINNYRERRFRNQDHSISNIGDQTALNADAGKNKLQTSRYARAARTILEDARTPPDWKRPATGCFQEINTRRMNMRRWAILDSGASSHFLMEGRKMSRTKNRSKQLTAKLAPRYTTWWTSLVDRLNFKSWIPNTPIMTCAIPLHCCLHKK